ncbi:MAG: glycerophosphodiester phosphodiesterase [Nocardioidaceae bacterium]
MSFHNTAWTRWLMLPVAVVTAATVLAAMPAHATRTFATGTPASEAQVASCNEMRVVAHRGYHRRHTENTMGAFRAAVRRGANAIETDLRTTRDNKVVLMHDRTIGRTTRGNGRVARMTGREIRRVRTEDGGRVPYVVHALRYLRHHPSLGAVMQMKKMTPTSLRRLRFQLVRTRTVGQVTLTSTRRTLLRRARRVMPEVDRVRITWSPVRPRRARKLVSGVMMPLNRLTAERVRNYRRLGLGVGAMPVDRPRLWRKLARVGILTLSTNAVARFRRFCQRVTG